MDDEFRKLMDIVEGGMSSSWVRDRQRERAETIASEYPEITPGMYVNLIGWFGDVWAEVVGGFRNGDEPLWYSVSFVKYAKYGNERKVDRAYYGDIRKVATAEEIAAQKGRVLIYSRDKYDRWGEVVVWPPLTTDHQLQWEKRPTEVDPAVAG